MDNFLKSTLLACFLFISGCSSVEQLPNEYWPSTANKSLATELVYVDKVHPELSVETTIVSINGYPVSVKNKLKVPVGKNAFKITCIGSVETRTVEIEYVIRANKKHMIQGLDNREGSCFITFTYI